MSAKAKIAGYRELSENEIAAINRIKALGVEAGELVDSLRDSSPTGPDQRWVSIGATQLQQGFMALTRSVAKPTTF